MTLTGAGAPSHAGHVLLSTVLVVVVLAIVGIAEQLRDRKPSAGRLTISAACAASAGIHLAVTPEHWAVDPLYGVFFLATAIAQLLAAGWLLVSTGHRLLVATAIGSAGLAVLWLETRLLGVPLGAEAGSREAFGLLDITSTALELLAVIACLRLLRPSGRALHIQV